MLCNVWFEKNRSLVFVIEKNMFLIKHAHAIVEPYKDMKKATFD